MKEILYIQKFIYIYKNNYVIKDEDLSNLFDINILIIIKRHKKLFKKYYFKINNKYLIKKEGVILLSIIINSFNIKEKTYYILDTFDILEKLNCSILNKISFC